MKIFGIVGWKNSGKTGLVERLVGVISARGFSVSTIKHAHHTFDVDKMGKDSYRHRQAGAREVLLSSKNRWALMSELRDVNEPSLSSLISKLSPVDLVLIEGYKRDKHSKIEAHRLETRQPLLAWEDETIIALASNAINIDVVIPIFNLDNTESIADFILSKVGLV
jgi:molybdopterin-guanine dinucleotide biosynthesis protein MobB